MLCKSCNSKIENNTLNFGNISKSSDFSKKINQKKKKYNLKLGSCSKCELIQIINPINYKKITPMHKWIMNKEENNHHSSLVERITKNKIINKKSKILALSHYDNKIISELNKKGYKNTKIFNLKKDININKPSLRQEIIQNFLNKKNSEKFKKKYGNFDMIISSKVLEHTQNLNNFFIFVKNILNKSGLLIIDVPDCEKSLKQGNITMIWEEHIFYFVRKTLVNTLNYHGFSKKFFYIYPYKQENSLVGIFKFKKSIIKKTKKINLLNIFRSRINIYKNLIHKKLYKYKKVLIFGAGHNSIIFVNLFKISKFVEFIIDDEKNKKGMYFPNTSLKILSSNYLCDSQSKLCLLGINPSSEHKIIKKFDMFKKQKGKFLSIYPDSKNFIINN